VKYHEWVNKARQQSTKDKISIPIIPASTYRDREKKLSTSGLLDWEKFWLVAHRLDTPGMKEMLAERKATYQKAKDRQMTAQGYRNEISRWYKKWGWQFNNGNRNPFDMLAHFRDKINADVTPTPKVGKKPKDYIAAKKKTEEKEKVERPSGSLFFLPPR
jgi:hypothetical protein